MIYEEEANKKVPTMANIVQNMGLIKKKKKRGRAKSPAQDTTVPTEIVPTE
jgi:hypothetical protein